MIQNGAHNVRDVTMGEDGHQMHTGHAPHALAALRNAILNCCGALAYYRTDFDGALGFQPGLMQSRGNGR